MQLDANTSSEPHEMTIGEMMERGELPDEIKAWMDTMGSFAEANLQQFITEQLPGILDDYGKEVAEGAKLHMLNMILPNGTRFGEACVADLIPYAYYTMDEIAELLADDPDDEEADFLKDGATPAPGDFEFVTEEELAERDKDIAHKQ